MYSGFDNDQRKHSKSICDMEIEGRPETFVTWTSQNLPGKRKVYNENAKF